MAVSAVQFAMRITLMVFLVSFLVLQIAVPGISPGTATAQAASPDKKLTYTVQQHDTLLKICSRYPWHIDIKNHQIRR